MASSKKPLNAVAIDWYVDFISKVCPAMLEVIGGGPLGLYQNASAAQRKKIVSGLKKIVAQATKIQEQAR
jgi:hypothetical protein